MNAADDMKGPESPESEFEVEYTITRDDAVDVSWTYGRASRRKTLLIGGAAAMASLAVWFVSQVSLALTASVFATLIVLLSVTRPWLRLMVRWTPATRVGTRCSLTLSGDGIAYRYDGVTGMIDWKAVTRVLEDDKAIVVLQGKAPLVAISKRALGSAMAVEAFKRELSRNAPSALWVR